MYGAEARLDEVGAIKCACAAFEVDRAQEVVVRVLPRQNELVDCRAVPGEIQDGALSVRRFSRSIASPVKSGQRASSPRDRISRSTRACRRRGPDNSSTSKHSSRNSDIMVSRGRDANAASSCRCTSPRRVHHAGRDDVEDIGIGPDLCGPPGDKRSRARAPSRGEHHRHAHTGRAPSGLKEQIGADIPGVDLAPPREDLQHLLAAKAERARTPPESRTAGDVCEGANSLMSESDVRTI